MVRYGRVEDGTLEFREAKAGSGKAAEKASAESR
jgi:hypothetical protein